MSEFADDLSKTIARLLELAEKATDPEVAGSLRAMAADYQDRLDRLELLKRTHGGEKT